MSFRNVGEYADDIVFIKEGLVTIAIGIGLSAAAMRSAVVSTSAVADATVTILVVEKKRRGRLTGWGVQVVISSGVPGLASEPGALKTSWTLATRSTAEGLVAVGQGG
jgi:hypothetical protein